MDVTLFSLGINFSNYFIIVSSAVAGVFFPKIVSMVALNQTNQALTRLMARVGRLQLLFIGLLMMGFIFFGQQFLTLWVGRTLGSSTYICWIIGLLVVIPLSLPLVQNLGIQIVQAKTCTTTGPSYCCSLPFATSSWDTCCPNPSAHRDWRRERPSPSSADSALP